MDVPIGKRSRSLKNKMFYYVFIILFFMVVLSVYSISVMNLYRSRIDDMFQQNLLLDVIERDLHQVDSELSVYLATKNSTSLNNYMKHAATLQEDVEQMKNMIADYSEEDLMILDIASMTDSYIRKADQAVQDKRRSNVKAYSRDYEEASVIKGYIESYINELNKRQLDSNADDYIYMTRQINTTTTLNLALVGVLVLLSLMIIMTMSDAIIEPIIHLSHSAGEIAEGRFETDELIVETNDEVEVLARAFNHMKRCIHNYIEELKEKAYTEALLKDQEMENLKMQSLLDNARLYALQSQMKPHFLFNTINAGVQMAMIEGADRTSEFLETMSRLFRYNIQQLDTGVSLDQELRNVKDYYELLKVRFGDLIEFRFNVDEGLLHGHIPPLTLQPIVENAYMHGLSKREEGGWISVEIAGDQEEVSVTISDNGVGMGEAVIDGILSSVHTKSMKEVDENSNGIGMSNVIERLELFYKREGLMAIESQPGQGTAIRLTIPYDKGDTDD